MKTIPFKIPSNWTWSTMGEIADVVGGGTPKTNDPENFEGGTIPWITPADLSGYTAKNISHGERFITAKGLAGSSAKMMPAGTVLFSSRAPVGYVAIAANPVCTNQGFKSFVLKTKDILPDFLYWWLKGNKELAESLASGTTFLELSGAKAKQLPIPLAPPGQQQSIVAEIEKQFSRLDEAVANLKRIKANLKRYKAAVLKAAVEGKLTEDWRKAHPDVEPASKLLERILNARRAKWNGKGKYKEPTAVDTNDLPELPKGWVWARLEQLGTIVGGFTKNPKRANLTRKLPYLRVANIYANELRLDEIENIGVQDTELEKLLLQKGDLLIVEGNGSKDQIGRLAIWDGSIDPCVHQNHLIKVRLVISSMDKWILFWLLSPSGRDYIEKVSSSTSGLYTLSVNKVGALPLIVPSLAQQEQITTEVESRLSVIEALEATVDANLIRANRFRQSILRVAFSGQLSLGLAPKTTNRDLPLASEPFSHRGELV